MIGTPPMKTCSKASAIHSITSTRRLAAAGGSNQ